MDDTQTLIDPQDQGTQPEAELDTTAPEDTTPTPEEEIAFLKKKHAESTREYQIQAAKTKALEEKLGTLTNSNVTDDELKSEYPDYENMTDTEKSIAKKNLILEKKFNAQQSYVAEVAFKEQQENELKAVLAKNPDLKTKEAEFKSYMSKKSHSGTPIDVLANAFLYEYGSTPKKKGNALETGRGDLGIRTPSVSKPLEDETQAVIDEMKAEGLDLDPKFVEKALNPVSLRQVFRS
jgi:hypothetical protein